MTIRGTAASDGSKYDGTAFSVTEGSKLTVKTVLNWHSAD
jgi:hypothetical protein